MALKDNEDDLSLKLRTMRYLWNLGFFVRRNVDMVRYDGQRRESEFTDVDVLGIRYDGSLEKNLIVCDCKSGFSVGNPERILILGGLISSLGADRGLYVRESVSESKYTEFAAQLNVRTVSSAQLDRLEKSLRIDVSAFYGAFSLDQSKLSELLALLKKIDKVSYEYMMVQYWYDSPHQRILTLRDCCIRIKNSFAIVQAGKTFLLCYCLSLLSLAALEFASGALYIPEDEREQFVKKNLIGGRLPYAEKRGLLSDLYDFMTKEIKVRYGQKYPIPKKDFVDLLIPPYAKYIVDLVSRICADPQAASRVPQALDLIAHEKLLYGKPVSARQLRLSRPETFDSVALTTGDFVKFAERSEMLDGDTTKAIERAIGELRNGSS